MNPQSHLQVWIENKELDILDRFNTICQELRKTSNLDQHAIYTIKLERIKGQLDILSELKRFEEGNSGKRN